MMQKKRYLLIFLLFLGSFLLLQSCGAAGAPPMEEPAAEEPSEEPSGGEPTAAPASTATLSVPVPTQAATMVPDIEVPTMLPSIPEQRRLTLEFPPKIRAGDSDIVRLTLEVDDMGNIVPTAEIEGNTVTGEVVEIPSLYDTHKVIAESRLDMAGVEVLPAEMISEPLLPGESVTFYWSVRPDDTGAYRGTVWLYLRFIPNDGGTEMTRTLSAQLIEINAVSFLGMKATPARWVGAIGSFISGVLGMPFIEEVVKWIWRRLKKI